MNQCERSSRDERNKKISDHCQDFMHLLVANFTQHEDPPLVIHILEHASTYKLPCRDNKGFQWNKALEYGARVTAKDVMLGGHGLYHKEPFVKLAASIVAEYVLLCHPYTLYIITSLTV